MGYGAAAAEVEDAAGEADGSLDVDGGADGDADGGTDTDAAAEGDAIVISVELGLAIGGALGGGGAEGDGAGLQAAATSAERRPIEDQ